MIEPSILEKINSSKGSLSLERYHLEMFLKALNVKAGMPKCQRLRKFCKNSMTRLTAIHNIRPQIEKDFGDIPEYFNSGDVRLVLTYIYSGSSCDVMNLLIKKMGGPFIDPPLPASLRSRRVRRNFVRRTELAFAVPVLF